MADLKISELPAANEPLNDADLVEIVQGGVNKKAPKSAFAGGGAVDSVNGQTGVVVLDAGDVGADPAGSAALRQLLINSATALVDGASMDLTAIKHTLTTSSATRTFTITYTGDDITLEVTLNAVTSVFTFPATSLCISEGNASGDNTCSLSGTSGDKYIIAIKKIGSAYYVVCKNFGQ